MNDFETLTVAKATGPYRIDTPDDLERLRRQFADHFRKTRSPETFHGIIETKPTSDLDFEVLRHIDFSDKEKMSRPKLHCSICQINEKFYEGVMSVWSDGNARLIGRDCATKLLGERVVSGKFDSYDKWAARHDYVGQLSPIVPMFEHAAHEADAFADSPAVRAAAKMMGGLRNIMPALYRALRDAAQNDDGALRIVRRRSKVVQQGGSGQTSQSEFETVTVETLEGRDALLSDVNPRSLASSAAKDFSHLAEILSHVDLENVDSEVLKSAIERTREAVNNLEKARRQIGNIYRLWSPTNRKAICRWTDHPDNRHFRDEYEVTTDGLQFYDNPDGIVRLDANISSLPSLTSVRKIRQLISDLSAR